MVAGRAKATRAVGRYLLVYELGQSYLGPLWAARVEGAEGSAPLAMLRLLSLARLDADTRVRLLEAAWQAMEVRDDRVCSVTDVVASDGELGIISDYIEGVTLRGLSSFASVRRKPAPPPVALRMALDLLSGVSALHRTTAELGDEAVPLYGGLSADSVLLSADGRTLVLDVAVSSAASSIDTLGGNPERAAYAAPEQLRSPPTADARTDVFAVGVLLWELLACRRLFVGSDNTVVQKVLSSKIPRPDELRRKGDPEMPSALVVAVMKALERDPSARPQSAEEFATLLTASGVLPAETEEVALYVTTLAEGALQRARDAVRSPASGPRVPTPRITMGAASPLTSEPRSPAQKPALPARPEAKPALPSRVAPEPATRTRQATMIGIPPPAVRPAPTVEKKAAPEPAPAVDLSEEEPTAQFTSRELLRELEAMGRRNEPPKPSPEEAAEPEPPSHSADSPDTIPRFGDAAGFVPPMEGSWLDDPASLPPPPLVDGERVTSGDPSDTTLAAGEPRIPAPPPAPNIAPNIAPSEAMTARVSARPAIPNASAGASISPLSPGAGSKAPAAVAVPHGSTSMAPSTAYLPSQVPPPLIHDPRARGAAARRRVPPPASVAPAISRAVLAGIGLSLGLVVASAFVGIHFLRVQRGENRESPAAKSDGVVAPTSEPEVLGATSAPRAPDPPAPAEPPVNSAVGALSDPLPGSQSDGGSAVPTPAPQPPRVRAPQAHSRPAPARAATAKKKGRYVPADI